MTARARGERFRYEGWHVDSDANRLVCEYSLDGTTFTESVVVPDGGDWSTPAAVAAARVVFLLAGVSYYKTGAPPVVDLGDTAVTDAELDLLRACYVDGLAEFAYENGLDLTDLVFEHDRQDAAAAAPTVGAAGGTTAAPLVPFGGGLDSIVTVELVRPLTDAALFVVNRPHDRFDAIERAAAVTGLPVVRAERAIDDRLLAPEPHWFNGHVPITSIISAIAVLTAALQHRPAVVMSNEWSASSPTITCDGQPINHQWSKGLDFETRFRDVVHTSVAADLDYFSRLRPYSELWIARQFAQHLEYHGAIHSCNRAFASDPSKRLDHWCGVCPKCCFVDLVLAPFLAADVLAELFDGREPLADPSLRPVFDGLLATTDAFKPFECVGDVDESRAAVLLTARRDDRAGFPLVHELARAVDAVGAPDDLDHFFVPAGEHNIPDAYATDDLLV